VITANFLESLDLYPYYISKILPPESARFALLILRCLGYSLQFFTSVVPRRKHREGRRKAIFDNTGKTCEDETADRFRRLLFCERGRKNSLHIEIIMILIVSIDNGISSRAPISVIILRTEGKTATDCLIKDDAHRIHI